MEVKIYREPENEQLIINQDDLDQYNELVSKLKLDNGITNQKTPSVYIALNSSMITLLRALTPAVSKVEQYTKSTIPLEVLKVLDYAKENQMFEGFEIWYADQNPDPLLIGWKYLDDEAREKQYSWRKNYTLIAFVVLLVLSVASYAMRAKEAVG